MYKTYCQLIWVEFISIDFELVLQKIYVHISIYDFIIHTEPWIYLIEIIIVGQSADCNFAG